ncbi:MAG: fumarylacetoacetate hydrolase family protein [Methylobacteriaceae bacterium]|nr:fumarylacetoacetate hydrolase family protein [Methylobacteriaceae bacterium]
MSRFVFDPVPVPSLPVLRSEDRVPVRRIFCVGRNYEEHAKEMGVAVDRETPFYFTKSPGAVALSGTTIAYPPGTSNYHHEMELVVVIGAPAFRVEMGAALSKVYGYCCGLDMTRRDLQLSERAKQRPWDLGKDVEMGAVLSGVAPAASIGHPRRGRIELRCNGATRQSADIAELVWSVPELIAHLSGFYHLAPGDLISTGTPAGVGPVEPGDRLDGSIEGVGEISVVIGEPDGS